VERYVVQVGLALGAEGGGVNLLPLHIASGLLAVCTGSVALYTLKGSIVHRRTGTIFVYAMISMSLSGALMVASGRSVRAANVLPGLLTTYLVVTAVTTMRPQSATVRRVDRGAAIAALALGLGCVVKSVVMLAAAGPTDRVAAMALLVFGAIPLLATEGDRRMMRLGGLRGAPRLTRHLWRMCAALLIVTASIILGRGFPDSLRIFPIRMIPFAVLGTMVFWLWRLRRGRRSQNAVLVGP
jgi:uncharacterized membrane protein